jgi:hypothetical protein
LAEKLNIKTIGSIAGTVAAGMVMAACAGPEPAPDAHIETAQHATTKSSRPIYLRAMKTQLATPRAGIGTLYTGTNCQPEGEVIWDDALFRQVSHQLPKTFRRGLQRAHYRVPSDSLPAVNIAGGDAARPEYVEVDMQVQEARADLCRQEEGTSGSVHMRIFWQVYSAGTSTPLYETTTQGSYHAPIMETRSTANFFANAFSMALSNLLAERGFHEAVTRNSTH